jgi:hypothetical protein
MYHKIEVREIVKIVMIRFSSRCHGYDDEKNGMKKKTSLSFDDVLHYSSAGV